MAIQIENSFSTSTWTTPYRSITDDSHQDQDVEGEFLDPENHSVHLRGEEDCSLFRKESTGDRSDHSEPCDISIDIEKTASWDHRKLVAFSPNARTPEQPSRPLIVVCAAVTRLVGSHIGGRILIQGIGGAC